MRKYQVDLQYWHAVLNDEIGGWAVTNYNTDATSKLNPHIGHRIVADCLNEKIARHIVELHNRELDREVESVATQFFDTIEIGVNVGDKKLLARDVVHKRSPLVAYEHAISQTAGLAISKLREGSTDGYP